eukprot:6526831-Lingulodinium_polyedra.AAC.1
MLKNPRTQRSRASKVFTAALFLRPIDGGVHVVGGGLTYRLPHNYPATQRASDQIAFAACHSN